jgi:hypothetical protein
MTEQEARQRVKDILDAFFGGDYGPDQLWVAASEVVRVLIPESGLAPKLKKTYQAGIRRSAASHWDCIEWYPEFCEADNAIEAERIFAARGLYKNLAIKPVDLRRD